MPTPPPPPDRYPAPAALAATRATLHRVATHVLARRRHALTGRIGLRATPGGFGTPAGGPEHEVVRLSGTHLVRERTGTESIATSLPLVGATLAEAAAHVDVDLTEPFTVGRDTPDVGDPSAPLALDPGATAAVAAWFALGWAVLDDTLATLAHPGGAPSGVAPSPSVPQLWPEHFDAGCDVAVAPGRRANLGASPGDAGVPQPYLYVGPWDAGRPGDPAYWNAPFGAVLTAEQLGAADDPRAAGTAFLLRGIHLLG